MNAKENGRQSVYPIQDMNTHVGPLGLTKREAFAMAAMQGMADYWNEDDSIGNLTDKGKAHIRANKAVILADALLAELSKEGAGS